jgi:Sap-like sulfolipid-1-addressing protein
MDLLELALLAMASAFWPTLIAVDLVVLRTPKPVKLLAWFLAAGLLTTISEGLVIVFVLEGTTLGSRSQRSVGGWARLIGGVAALAVAFLLRAWAARRRREPQAAKRGRTGSASWTERVVARGAAFAFAAGIVLNLFPGIGPLVALREIAALGYGDGAKAALVVGFYIVMFALVELPLVGLLLAPQRVGPSVQRLNGWLDRNRTRAAIDALVLVGAFLVVRGIVQLAMA